MTGKGKEQANPAEKQRAGVKETTGVRGGEERRENRSGKDTKTEKNDETLREKEEGPAEKDKGITQEEEGGAREKHVVSSGTERLTKGRHQRAREGWEGVEWRVEKREKRSRCARALKKRCRAAGKMWRGKAER